ncbi:MAG: glycosyltransferase family 2 protein [Armatimonadota bacterium]
MDVRPDTSGAVDTPVHRDRVTVVLPTYNRRASLLRCLEALLACDRRGVEVTVRIVDDGSTDGTEAAVQELRERCPEGFTLVYHRQRNQGPSAARNLAIRESETDLILFIDDDCIPEPGWISALVGVDWDAGVGAAAGRIVSPEQSSWVSRYCRHIGFNDFPPRSGVVTFANTANCAYRRAALLEVEGLEERVSGGGEDQDLTHRVVLLGYRLAYAPNAVVRHFHRESFRVLARTFYHRGYRMTMRKILWGRQAHPSWKWLKKELISLGQVVGTVRSVRAEARRLRGEGIEAGDALRFAWMDWLRETLLQAGKIRMMLHILRGKQQVARTSRGVAGDLEAALAARAPGQLVSGESHP